MKNRILTIVCMIGAGLAACVVLDKPAGVQAAISNPSYFKSLIIGGGITDADGGAQIEDNGNITTTGDITLDDLNIGDDVDINGDLNVDGVTTLDDTTIDGPLDVNGASTFDVDVEFYDATQDPDELVGFVNTDYDTDTGQIGATGNLLAINDPFSPTSIAGVGIIGPIADRTTNQAPRLELMSATDYMDMALESGGVGVDMPNTGANSLLSITNSDGTYTAGLDVEGTTSTGALSVGGGYGSTGASIDGSGNVSLNGALVYDGKRRTKIDNNTISSGSIVYESEYQRTDTEGAASTDDLVTVTGGVDGDVMFLRSTAAARDIVLKHGTGTDQLTLRDGVDFTLDTSFDIVTFVRGTTSWFEVSRTDSGGSGTPAASGTYTPTVTNIDFVSIGTVHQFNYSRTGKIVTVSGSFNAVGYASDKNSATISLPISTTMASNTDCSGTASVTTSTSIGVGYVEGATSLATASIYGGENPSTSVYYVTFTYEIL